MTTTASALDLPFDEAIAYFRQKANVPTERWTDVYGAAHARSFSVAGAATDALLADFRAEIDKALAEGTTIAEFRKGFDGIEVATELKAMPSLHAGSLRNFKPAGDAEGALSADDTDVCAMMGLDPKAFGETSKTLERSAV